MKVAKQLLFRNIWVAELELPVFASLEQLVLAHHGADSNDLAMLSEQRNDGFTQFDSSVEVLSGYRCLR